jgi:hypothetical protein
MGICQEAFGILSDTRAIFSRKILSPKSHRPKNKRAKKSQNGERRHRALDPQQVSRARISEKKYVQLFKINQCESVPVWRDIREIIAVFVNISCHIRA